MITKKLMFLMRHSMPEASRLNVQLFSEHFSRFFGTPLLKFIG